MRIAQVAPLYESVPPARYGGTERVVAYLTDELVRQGHDVTLFASGDSTTSARLVAIRERSIRLDATVIDPLADHILMLEKVLQRAAEFDIVHFHVDYLHFPLSRRMVTPQLTTLHGRLDLPDLQAIFDEFHDMPVASISDAQRRPLPQANWCGTVHHGLPDLLHRPCLQPDDYFAFIGRISPEERVDRAIEIAQRLQVPLKVAAKIDRADREYFEEHVRPLFEHPLVEFIGEISEGEKTAFLGQARAVLFPVDWPEPFGLVMIEAMACGTPVVAFRCGSVPEVIEPGVNGFIVDDVDEGTVAAAKAALLDRAGVRAAFERRLSAGRMARDYVALYEQLIAAAGKNPRPARVVAA